jgi:hypothetical protein
VSESNTTTKRNMDQEKEGAKILDFDLHDFRHFGTQLSQSSSLLIFCIVYYSLSVRTLSNSRTLDAKCNRYGGYNLASGPTSFAPHGVRWERFARYHLSQDSIALSLYRSKQQRHSFSRKRRSEVEEGARAPGLVAQRGRVCDISMRAREEADDDESCECEYATHDYSDFHFPLFVCLCLLSFSFFVFECGFYIESSLFVLFSCCFFVCRRR